MLQQLLLNGIIAGSIYALVALGFTLIYRTVRFFHIAHGAIYTLGAYLAYTFAQLVGLRPWGAVILSVVVAAAAGVAIDECVYKPLRRRGAPTLVFLIASFGVFVSIQSGLQLAFGAQVLSPRLLPAESYDFLGVFFTNVQVFILVSSGCLWLALSLLSSQTAIGKAMRAVSDDPFGAMVAGINPDRVIRWSFALGSGIAAAAGILISLETNLDPAMGLNAILKGIIASIIGGVGNIHGAFVGGLVLGIAENVGIYKVSSTWKDSIAFVVLLLLLAVRPGGLVNRQRKKGSL